MGSHKQALEIYVFKLKDYDKAEEYVIPRISIQSANNSRYCNRVHLLEDTPGASPIQTYRAPTSESDEPPPSIYHTLLSLYLTPPPPHKSNWQPALSLLSKHGARLPASSTLEVIPATIPVAELESYFRGRIRAANSIINESRIMTGLHKTQVVSAQAELLLGERGRNRKVLVQEERVCGVCHKRLSGSVVGVLPDNSVVHYGCLGRVGSRKTTNNGGMEALRGGWR